MEGLVLLLTLLPTAAGSTEAGADRDGDTVPDDRDRCVTVGRVFGDRGAIGGVDGAMPADEASARGLTGCPYLDVYGCDVWGESALKCSAMSDALAVLRPALAGLSEASADPQPTRHVLLVDGLEDVTPVAPRVFAGPSRTGPSDGFVSEGDEAVRALRAWSRARAAVEVLRGEAPDTPVELGLSHLRQPSGVRGVRVILSPDPTALQLQVNVIDWTPPDPPTTEGREPELLPGATLEPGVVVGYAWLHGYDFTGLGVSLRFDPGWRSRLSFELAYLSMTSRLPVYLTRWESTQRLDQLSLGGRWRILRRGSWTPFVAAGAFSEPSVEPVGPWGSLGLTHLAGSWTVDLALRAPIYPTVPDLGVSGVQVLVQAHLRSRVPKREQRQGE